MSQHPTSVSPSHPWNGRLVGDGDRYRLDQPLGSGGMGDVFLATDTRLGKVVALKLLKDALAIAADVDLKARFERECAICAALKSVHIVQVSDYGVTAEGYPFYVMECLQGETLGQRLASQPRLSLEQTGHIITQVCAGLDAAHTGVMLWNRETNSSERIKVVHRDLKPDNIFLTPTALGELVKVIDFGIAKIHSLQAEYTSATNMFLGTCHYASPEQSDGGAVDERSDIYSLGVILYEMLTGIDPFGLDFRKNRITNNAWLAAHAFKPVRPLRSHLGCAAIPPELDVVVLRCLAKSPAERFASVNQLRVALQAAIAQPESSDATTYSVPSSPPDPTARALDIVAPAPPKPTATAATQSVPAADAAFAKPRSTRWGVVAGVLLTVTAIGVFIVPKFWEPMRLFPSSGVREWALAKTLTSGSDAIGAICLSADGNLLISAEDDPNATQQNYAITLWDVRQQVNRTIAAHRGVVRSLSLSADSSMLASSSDDRTIKLWNPATGDLIRTLEGHTAPVLSVALSADGQTLVSGSSDQTVRIWHTSTGESRSLLAHTDEVTSVALSSDGQAIASSSADKTIRLWDQTGELVRTLGEPGGHRDVISTVAFSADGQQLVSSSWDKTVKSWDATTGQLLHTLEGHTDRVTAAVFVGQAIASGSFDHTIRIWDGKTGSLVQTIPAHTSRVLALSAIDSELASSSGDTTIKLWH